MGDTAGQPMLLSLVCREQFWLWLLFLPRCRVEEQDFANAQALTEHVLALVMQAASGRETKTALQCASLAFSSSKTTSSFQGRYFISTNVPPVKTTSLLLMAELSITSSVTQPPFSPSKCQTSSSLLTHPVPAF